MRTVFTNLRTGIAMGAVLGLMAITFTWYGVNYILGTGLHSYGFGKGANGSTTFTLSERKRISLL